MKSFMSQILRVFKKESKKEYKNVDIYKFCSSAEDIVDTYCQIEGYSNK